MPIRQLKKIAALGAELREHLAQRGASAVAYADLTELPVESRGGLRSGVSIALALDPQIVAGLHSNSGALAYAAEYQRANAHLNALADLAVEFLRQRAFRSVALAATTSAFSRSTFATTLPHKTVATRAGLGWIGRSALLVTEEFGSAIRLATVLTAAELPYGVPVESSACGDCHACVQACPVRALTGNLWQKTTSRNELCDAEVCYRHLRERRRRANLDATVCGLCLQACPRTQRYLSECAARAVSGQAAGK